MGGVWKWNSELDKITEDSCVVYAEDRSFNCRLCYLSSKLTSMVNMQDALLKSMIYEVAILLACPDEFELGRRTNMQVIFAVE